MARVLLGCIKIASDEVIENEAKILLSFFPDVDIVFSKLPLADGLVTPESFMKSASTISTSSLRLGMLASPSVIGLACTSMSFTLGIRRVDQEIHAGCINVQTTDMARGQIDALHALGIERVCLLTPYIDILSKKNAEFLRENGIQVLRRHTLNLVTDEETSLITKESIRKMVTKIDCEEADAIVIGCSAFRVCEQHFIDNLENVVGKPVITSTQAFLWKMLRTAGVQTRISGYGRLFSRC